MGLIAQSSPEGDPKVYFARFDNVGEVKLSRSAAAEVCEMALEHGIWILGVDVGTLFEDGVYLEDYDEGWLSKTGLMDANTRKEFDPGIVQEVDLRENDRSASVAIEDSPEVFNAFILTGKRVRCATWNYGDALPDFRRI